MRQLQEKYLAKKKNLYFAFVDLEKALDRVLRNVILWALKKLGVNDEIEIERDFTVNVQE